MWTHHCSFFGSQFVPALGKALQVLREPPCAFQNLPWAPSAPASLCSVAQPHLYPKYLHHPTSLARVLVPTGCTGDIFQDKDI